QWLDEAGLPGVAIASSQPDDSLSALGIDDAAAARAMPLHLLDLGHRRIGFVLGPSDHASAALRRQGWLQALSERGIATDDSLMV
ncbi:substrate-binding domain-containing protein, partial [Mesorhizobium japonicum]|uniref:substrate-binding domain-containing protein n=1 Tax=Mesorhizobium japonicum TaxID=2066070 RepID=UPI003B5A685D